MSLLPEQEASCWPWQWSSPSSRCVPVTLYQQWWALLPRDRFLLGHCACGMSRTEQLEQAGARWGSLGTALGELPFFPLLGSFCSPAFARQMEKLRKNPKWGFSEKRWRRGERATKALYPACPASTRHFAPKGPTDLQRQENPHAGSISSCLSDQQTSCGVHCPPVCSPL